MLTSESDMLLYSFNASRGYLGPMLALVLVRDVRTNVRALALSWIRICPGTAESFQQRVNYPDRREE